MLALLLSSEEAVEYGELTQFLRLNDKWDPTIDEDRPQLQEVPIGVPGANSPSQMAKLEHKASFNTSPSPSPAPLKGKSGPHLSPESAANDPGMQRVVAEIRKRNEEEFDVSEELSGYGLQGVKVTHDDLMKLVEDLGLEGDDAGDLVKGLSDMTGDRAPKAETKPLAKKATAKLEPKSGAGSKVEPLAKKEVKKEETKKEEVKKEVNSDKVKVEKPPVAKTKPVPKPTAEKAGTKEEAKEEAKKEEKGEDKGEEKTEEKGAEKAEEKTEKTEEKGEEKTVKAEEKVAETVKEKTVETKEKGEEKQEEKVGKEPSRDSVNPPSEEQIETELPEVKVSGAKA